MIFFPVPAALAAAVWLASTLLRATAQNALGSSGPVVWTLPAASTVVAECYPLSIQFTSTSPPKNVSFFYYVGVQSEAGQRIELIHSYPESQWVDASTVYAASSASVPIAAGSMIALQVVGYDNVPSFLTDITVQPNTDTSCITSPDQQGAADYNYLSRQPATTTVSPATTAAPNPPPASDPAPSATTSSPSSTPTLPAASAASSPASSPSSTSLSHSAEDSPASSGSPSSPTSQSAESTSASVTPLAANAPGSTTSSTPQTLPASSATSKHSSTGIIVGALLAALVGLAVAIGTILWVVRRRNQRRMADARDLRSAAPYDVAPPPIREVDAGRIDPERAPPQYPERLPPQYDDIPGSDSGPSSARTSGKGPRPHPNLNYL
ncbi:hypothetical protein K438DRAFT_1827370 [Mycena galopus ATCC 62051]|nr:hypothetical protein K438DRAFT_1827370 [Mycena galopus ATCC 62051]